MTAPLVRRVRTLGILAMAWIAAPMARADEPRFTWPDDAQAALSLTFDDARASQLDVGLGVLDSYGVKATFFVVPSAVEARLDGWKRAVAAGHEIGNHSLTHPCSGNFAWARAKALEQFSLGRIRRELVEANLRIKKLLGVTAETFAYPCGQTFVGRGRQVKSYVPLVAQLFLAGRGWMAETPQDPRFGDLAQVLGIEMDGKDFEGIRPLLDQARETGGWIVLGGHEIGEGGRQTTRLALLHKLLPYARDPANRLWLAPVATVAKYVKKAQPKGDTR